VLTCVWRWIALTIIGAAALGGCGTDGADADRDEIVAVVEQLQNDFEVGDVEAICRATSAGVHEQLAASAHGEPASCPVALDRVLLLIEEGLLRSGPPRVSDVSVDGDEAVVSLEAGDGPDVAVPFKRTGDRWRMSNFFGVEALPEAKPFARPAFPVPRSNALPPTDAPVRAFAASGAACPALAASAAGTRGECDSPVSGAHRFDVRTVLGTFPLGRCNLEGKLQIDGRGNVALHDIALPGPSPCNDLVACRDRAGERRPWLGVLRGDPGERLDGRLAMCLDTCVGRFKGPVDVSVEKTPAGWRMTFGDAPVGSGSLALSGSSPVAGMDAIRVRAG